VKPYDRYSTLYFTRVIASLSSNPEKKKNKIL
jgi:hypothetical protein